MITANISQLKVSQSYPNNGGMTITIIIHIPQPWPCEQVQETWRQVERYKASGGSIQSMIYNINMINELLLKYMNASATNSNALCVVLSCSLWLSSGLDRCACEAQHALDIRQVQKQQPHKVGNFGSHGTSCSLWLLKHSGYRRMSLCTYSWTYM